MGVPKVCQCSLSSNPTPHEETLDRHDAETARHAHAKPCSTIHELTPCKNGAQGDELVDPQVSEAHAWQPPSAPTALWLPRRALGRGPLGPRIGVTEYSLGSQAPPIKKTTTMHSTVEICGCDVEMQRPPHRPLRPIRTDGIMSTCAPLSEIMMVKNLRKANHMACYMFSVSCWPFRRHARSK